MGRPKGFNGKCEQYRLRLSQEENYILKKLAEKEGLSKAEVLRKGLKISIIYRKMVELLDIQK